jgi:hypothetical protein
MMLQRAPIAAVAVLGLALACAAEPASPSPEPGRTSPVTASIEFLNLEGGCWVIARGDTNYLPLNLPDRFRRNGLQVDVEFVRRDDYASTCMVGPVVEILSIRER